MVKKLQYTPLLAVLIALLSAFTMHERKMTVNNVRVVVIDPGHGGKDPGCMGSTHKEKDIALAVALKLGKFIEQNMKGVKVIYTRTTDVFVELEDRAQIANKAKADLFISIHCNAAGKPVMITDPKTGKKRPKTYKNKKGRLVVVETSNPVPYGSETYVMGLKNEEGKMKVATRENSAIFLEDDYEKKYGGFDPESEESYIIMSNYTSAYVIQSADLALKIQEEYARKAGRVDKGVHRQSIWVLWRTSMPSILTELGYLTNPLEETFLGSEKGQDYMARALFRGLRRYKDEAEGRKAKYDDEFENQEPLQNENLVAGNSPYAKKPADDEDSIVSKPTIGDSIMKAKSEKVSQAIVDPKEGKPKAEKQDAGKQEQQDTATIQEEDLTAEEEQEDTVSTANAIAEKFKKEQGITSHTTSAPTTTVAESKTLSVAKPPETASVAAPKPEIVFKVQFASSDVMLNLKDKKFESVKDADFYKMGNVLKYTSGKFVSVKDASAHQAMLREKGFKDCFVVAFLKGQRIDVAEARRLSGQ